MKEKREVVKVGLLVKALLRDLWWLWLGIGLFALSAGFLVGRALRQAI